MPLLDDFRFNIFDCFFLFIGAFRGIDHILKCAAGPPRRLRKDPPQMDQFINAEEVLREI